MSTLPARPLLICAYSAVALIGSLATLPAETLLDISALVTVFSIVTRLIQNRSLSLPMVWELGFLAIVYYGVRSEVAEEGFQCSNPSTVSAILVLGHCAAVVAMDLFGGLVGPSGPRNKSQQKIAHPVVTAIYIICVIYLVPVATQAALLGRVSVAEENSDPISQILKAACMLAPTMVTLSVSGSTRTRLIKGYLYSSPILLALIGLGTRYFVLCAIAAPMLAIYGPRISGTRVLLRYGALALTLLVATSAMLAFRSVGILARSENVQIKVGLSTEGILFQTCALTEYFRTNPHLQGASALSMAVVLVPRALWADKPALIDYWFPRAAGQTGFGSTHSISTAYVGDGYADFGVIGVALYGAFWGLLVGYGQRVVASAWSAGTGDAHRALASLLLAIVYFGVRSPITAAVQVLAFCVILGAAQLISGLLEQPAPGATPTDARTAIDASSAN